MIRKLKMCTENSANRIITEDIFEVWMKQQYDFSTTFGTRTSIIYLIGLVFILFQMCGCGGGGSDNNPPDEDPILPTNVIEVTEDIEEPTIWENRYIYVIPENLYVKSTLTIQAGTVVKCRFETKIDVDKDGIVDAKGTPDEPIVFTSDRDDSQGGDTNMDENASEPGMGDWEGITISGGQGSVFDHCAFWYAGVSRYNSPLKLVDAQAQITHCQFAHNGGGHYHVHYYGALDAGLARLGTVISNNRFYDNIIPLSINHNYDLDDSNTFQDTSGTVFNTYNAVFFRSNHMVDNSMSGEINRNVVWEETEVAIVIDLTYCKLLANTSLTLGDDVVLKFLKDSQFNLYDGQTALVNHDGNGVFFTSFKDDDLKGDSNGDGDATSPAEHEWVGFIDGRASTGPVIAGWPNVFYSTEYLE